MPLGAINVAFAQKALLQTVTGRWSRGVAVGRMAVEKGKSVTSHSQDIEDIRFWACSAFTSPLAEQVKAIYIEAFPDVEREPFDNLARSINDGSRWLYCAGTKDGVSGFGVIRPLLGSQVVLLEYYATERTIRGHGPRDETAASYYPTR